MEILIIFVLYFCVTSSLQYWFDDNRILNKIRKDVRKSIMATLKNKPIYYDEIGFEKVTMAIQKVFESIPEKYLEPTDVYVDIIFDDNN